MSSTIDHGAADERTDVLPRPRLAPGVHRPAVGAYPVTVMPPAGLGPAYAQPGVTPGGGMRWGWLAVGLAAAMLAVVALLAFAGAHRRVDVHGTVTVYGLSGALAPGSACYGAAYVGMPVSIYDASGELVGSSSLTGYGAARDTWRTYSSSGWADSCEYSFTAADVPVAGEHYRLKAGSGTGEGVAVTRAELESGSVGITYH